jgi:hypothetical protein
MDIQGKNRQSFLTILLFHRLLSHQRMPAGLQILNLLGWTTI